MGHNGILSGRDASWLHSTQDGSVGVPIPNEQSLQRAFRRILSGSADGRPVWVTELMQPGDAGWFGPGSAIWTVHGSMATLVGGVRALLLQATHPLALAGVQQHSDYRQDALGRLQRTNRFITTTTFGSSKTAAASLRRVGRAHQAVVGTAGDGRPYSANDPHLQLWVHVALVDSMLTAAEHLEPRDFDPDGYVADMAVIAGKMGMRSVPVNRQELADALEAFRPELAGGDGPRAIARFVSSPPLPRAALPPYAMLFRFAVDLLPDWAHPLLGTSRRPTPVRAVDRAAATALISALRAALGATSPGETAALQRIASSLAAELRASPSQPHRAAARP
jgi:uncharacterized protein (DUF2236 family)